MKEKAANNKTMKYENTFKAIDQILWKEQGCGSELDYLEQKSWMLFLKYLDDLETENEGRERTFVDARCQHPRRQLRPQREEPQQGGGSGRAHTYRDSREHLCLWAGEPDAD